MRRILPAVVFVGIFFIIWRVTDVSAAAGIYRTINFQGKIVNKADGTNIGSQSYSFTFKLYDAASGGNQLPTGTPWSETQSLTVTDGIFRATLGSSTPFPATLDFNSDSLYLDITFNGETFGSRVRLTAVPYAFNAEKVNGLTVTNTTGTLTIPGGKTVQFGDAFTTSGANPLTLTTSGTTNATLPSGTITLVDLSSNQSLSGKTIDTTSAGLIFSGGSTDITTGTNQDFTILPNGSGMVGIGTTSTTAMLTVKGDATASGNITMGGQLQIGRFGAEPIQAGVGSMYYNTATNKFRCFVNNAWTDCTTPSLLTDGGTFTYLTSTTNDFLLGGVTAAAASFNMDVSAGALYLGTNESINGSLTLFSSGAGKTDPSITANAAGDLTLNAPSGQVVVGAGTGNIGMSLGGASDIFTADKTVTLGGANALTDFTFKRVFTGGSYSQGGQLFLIQDSSGGSGTISPDLLVVNSALTSGSFTGNLLRLQVGGSDKFTVDSTGSLKLTGVTSDITTATGEHLALMPGTGGNVGIGSTVPTQKLDVTGNATVSGNVTMGGQVQLGRFGAEPSQAGIGSMYYNTSLNKFRCYINSAWADCDTTGGALTWSNIIAPTTNLGINMYQSVGTSFTTTFTYGNATSTNNLFTITDTASNTGTGYMFNLTTAASSTLKPLHVSAAGTEAILVNAAGNVGIGNLSPLEKLDVTGSATISGNLTLANSGPHTIATRAFNNLFIGDTQTGNIFLIPGTGNQINFYSSSNNISSSGNMTLAGTITANTTSTINGVSISSGAVSTVSTLNMTGILTNSANGNAINLSGTNPAIYTSSTNRLDLTANSATVSIGANSGNVGIGTTAANSKLELNSGSSGISGLQFTQLTSSSTAGAAGTKVLSVDSTGKVVLVTDSTGSGTLPTGATGNTIYYNGSSWVASSNIYNNNANVGIGSTAPTQKLDVTGNATVSGNITLGGQLQIGRFGADPATLGNGTMYYNTTTNTFRCYVNGAWADCNAAPRIVNTSDSTTNTTLTASEQSLLNATITPSNSSDYIWVTATMQIQIDTTNAARTVTMRVRKGADCTGTQIGSDIAIQIYDRNSTAHTWTGDINVVDTAPGSSAVTYRLCAVTSTGSPVAQDRQMTIEEVRSGADLAEMYATTDTSIIPGTVVSLDPEHAAAVTKSTRPYDSHVLGVVSTKPGLLLAGPQPSGMTSVPVALSGRIPVMVSAENGPIDAGDYLTTSTIPGVAMRADKAGYVVGQALESYSSDGIGLVMAFVKNTFSTGSLDSLDSTGVNVAAKQILTGLVSNSDEVTTAGTPADLSVMYTDRVVAGLDVIAPRVVAELIETNGLVIGGEATGSAAVLIDNHGNASFSGTLTADTIRANHIEGLELMVEKLQIKNTDVTDHVATMTAALDGLSGLEKRIASLEAGRAAVTGSETASVSGKLTDAGLLFNAKLLALDGMAVVGKSNLDDLFVSGNMQIGLLAVNGMDSSVSATGGASLDLAAGALQFRAQDGLVFASKSLFNNDVEFAGHVSFNRDAAGYAIVREGDDRVQIAFTKPYEKTPIVNISIVSMKQDENGNPVAVTPADPSVAYAVTQLDTNGFTIILNKNAPRDLRFSWTAVLVKEPDTFTSSDGAAAPEPTVAPTAASQPTAVPTVEPVVAGQSTSN